MRPYPDRALGRAAALLLLTLLPACELPSGTGGREVRFTLELATAAAPSRSAGSFTTSTGWDVTLESAVMALGPVYLYENPPHLVARGPAGGLWDALVPPAHAHTGSEHFDGGEVKGEWLGQIALDALAPGVRLGHIPGTAGGVRSLSVGLHPPRTSIAGDAGRLEGHHAYVVGVATRGDLEIPFEGGLDIEAEGNKREVAGIPLTAELDDGVSVTIELHLEAWFDEAHFDRLTEKSPRGRFLITRSTQAGTAWFIGARGAAAFSAKGSRAADQGESL
ncbi:hypothetical protein WME98_17860 [Sorangium sp. So ce296]|uniref:hypothetical protein n=1 Tax=Sorangium sp. So ce296 TaxID=3133296 RepID=UPI003F5DBBCA